MRKLAFLVLSFFIILFIIGYPVLARYYNSTNSGPRIGTQRALGAKGLVNSAVLPKHRVSKADLSVQKPAPVQRPAKEQKPALIRKPALVEEPVSDQVSAPESQPVSSEITTAPKSPELILINKNQGLPPTYTPSDLTVPHVPFAFKEDLPKKKMTMEAARALEKLFARAKTEQIELAGVSAYRSYDYQQVVFERNVAAVGKEAAGRISAAPGHSEHQSGLAIDVSSPEVNNRLDEKLGATRTGQWLADNASKYGFIIRYPEDKEKITGYQYEPWHLRYVGKDSAQEMAKAELTLEEYLDRFEK